MNVQAFNKNVFTDLDFLQSTNRPSQEESFVGEISVPSVATDDTGLPTPKSNKTAVIPSRDLAVPGTSREFQNIINKISPVPENLQNEIVTATPYKGKLEEKWK